MTHFVCGVIVPKNEVEFARDYIDETLEKYSEEYEVEPYIEQTKKELRIKFEKWKIEMNETLKHPTKKLENYELKYVENGKLKKISIKEWLGSWCDYHNFDKNGNLLSTYNKNSFFDYYSIGGRWSGLFYGKDDGESEELEKNMISIKDLIKKYKSKEKDLNDTRKKIIRALSDKEVEYNPYSISVIVVDGKIYQEKSYGWFGTSNQKIDEDKWKKDYLKLLEEHKEDFIVNLDCHI